MQCIAAVVFGITHALSAVTAVLRSTEMGSQQCWHLWFLCRSLQSIAGGAGTGKPSKPEPKPVEQC